MRDLEIVPDSLLHPSSDRPTFIDRLANSLTKRKRSTPQKFVGKGIFPPPLLPGQTGKRRERGAPGCWSQDWPPRSRDCTWACGWCSCSAFHPHDPGTGQVSHVVLGRGEDIVAGEVGGNIPQNQACPF